jgi:hypothetical protein
MRARGRPLGWDHDPDDPEGPTLEGKPEWVEGEYRTAHIQSELGSVVDYVKHIIGSTDVDPATIIPLDLDLSSLEDSPELD